MSSLNVMKVVSTLSLVLLCACAARPDKIAALNVDQNKYLGVECRVLGSELQNAQTRLREAEAKQNSAANTDAWWLLLSIVPVSKVTGDHAVEVAELKGEVNAISAVQQQKRCV